MKKKTVISTILLSMLTICGEAMGSTTISGAYETAWTEGYIVDDKAEFDIEVKGGDGTSDNVITIFESSKTIGLASPREEIGASYKEYMVIQTDCYGWGFGKNCSLDGNAINYYNNVDDYDKDGDVWDDFVDIMKDAHIDATIAKTSNGIEVQYYVTGANGHSFVYKAQTIVDTSDGLYVIFACKDSEITVTRVDGKNEVAEVPKKEEVVEIVEEQKPLATSPSPEKEDLTINKVTSEIIIEEVEKENDLSKLDKMEVETIIYKADAQVEIDFEKIPKAAPEGKNFSEEENDEEKIYKIIAIVSMFIMVMGVIIIGRRDIASVKKRKDK